MPRLRWTGPGIFSDAARDFEAQVGVHDVSDEQADEYLDHPQHGGWERVDDDADADSGDESDDAEVAPENPAVEPTAEDREFIPTDPAEFTVDEFEAHIEESDYSAAELEQFARVEASGKDRVGVHEAIDEEL